MIGSNDPQCSFSDFSVGCGPVRSCGASRQYFTHHEKGGSDDGGWVEGRFPDFITKDNQNLIGAIMDPRCVKIFKRHLDRCEAGQQLFPLVERTYPSKLMKKLVQNAAGQVAQRSREEPQGIEAPARGTVSHVQETTTTSTLDSHSATPLRQTPETAWRMCRARITSMMTGHSSQAMIDLYTDKNIDAVKSAVLLHARL